MPWRNILFHARSREGHAFQVNSQKWACIRPIYLSRRLKALFLKVWKAYEKEIYLKATQTIVT